MKFVKVISRTLQGLLALLLSLLVLVVFVLTIALGTETGRLWLVEQGTGLAGNAGIDIHMTQLQSPGLDQWSLATLTVAMNGSPLVAIDQLALSWRPWSLFQKHIEIHALTAARVHYFEPEAREPETEPADDSGGGQMWPVTIDELAVGEIGVFDTAGDTRLPLLRVGGAGKLFHDNIPVQLQADVETLSDPITKLVVDSQALSSTQIRITGSLQEPPAGWLGGLLSLPDAQGLDARFDIELTQNQDELRIDIESFSLPFLQHALAARGSARLQQPGNTLTIRELLLEVDDNRQRIKGTVSPEDLFLDVQLSSLPLTLAKPWLPELQRGSASGRVEVDWFLAGEDALPNVAGNLEFDVGIHQQAIKGSLEGSLKQNLVQLQPGWVTIDRTRVTLQGTVDLDGDANALQAHVTDFTTDILAPWPVELPEGLTVTNRSTRLELQGSFDQPRLLVDGDAHAVYQGQQVSINAQARASKDAAQITRLQVDTGNSRLQAEGKLDWTTATNNLTAQFTHLDNGLLAFLPEETRAQLPDGLRFDASGTAQIKGELQQPDLATEFTIEGDFEEDGETIPFVLSTNVSLKVAPLENLAVDIRQFEAVLFEQPVFDLKGHYRPDDMNLQLSMSRLPTRTLAAFGLSNLSGDAQAALSLTGQLAQPVLEGHIHYARTLNVVGRGGAQEVPVAVDTRFSQNDEQLMIEINLQQSETSAGQINIALPLQQYLDALQSQSQQPLPLAADIQGNLDLQAVNLLMDTTTQTFRGRLLIDTQLAGDLSNPAIDGQVQLAEGYYQNVVAGVELWDMALTLRGDGNLIRLDTAQLKTPGNGQISAEGRLDWRAAQASDRNALQLQILARNATLVQRADVEGQINGEININGHSDDIWVKGEIEVAPLNINIGAATAGSIPRIEIIDEEEQAAAEQAEAESAAMPTVHLDLRIFTDQQAYLRGRGLDTELFGEIKLTGTADEPNYTGTFNTRRGRLDILNKRFTLAEGQVRIANEVIGLNITSTYADADHEYRVEVFGTVNEPQINLSSTPALAEDQILSRLIFGKSVQEISAFEALRLAAAVNSLRSGSSFDPIDNVRDRLGVDTLTVGGGSGADQSGLNVGVGKYLSDRVYLELERSNSTTATQQWQSSVQIELTSMLTLKGGTGDTGSGKAELLWKRDY